MRGGRMFTRLLTVSLAVILACVGVLFALSYTSLRDARIESRMDALKTQARDMAYLASSLSGDTVSRAFGLNGSTEDMLRWKARRIYSEYSAYVMLVDRGGQAKSYYIEQALQNESMQFLPTQDELSEYLQQVMHGEEVVVQTDSAMGPLFTVIVPWVRQNLLTGRNTVMGLVLIQTAAQTVHASYQGLLRQFIMTAVILLLIAGVSVFFFTRQITKPLTVMADAAESMAKGDFKVHAPETGSEEIRQLSSAFNRMASQLSTLEDSRRDFVANVSHELRSPITSIQGFAQGMRDGTIPKEEHEKYLQVVVDETHRLSKLINNLLNLSRIENEETSLACTDFDVNELTRRVLISRMTALEEKNMEVEADFEHEECFVFADQEQIQQVIINLIDNAVKYTPEGGAITLSSCEEDGHIALRVKDNGVGILPEDAPHIFERFYKADKAHTVGKGTGLGLAICARIMEKHGQSIRLVSGEGGAEFEITLKKGKNPGGNHADQGTGKDQLDA